MDTFPGTSPVPRPSSGGTRAATPFDDPGPPGVGHRPRVTPAGEPVPEGCPLPENVLAVATGPGGRSWRMPFVRADPVLLTAGLPVDADGYCDARTEGSLHLPDPQDRDRHGTYVEHALARPFRMWWADPDTAQVRSHVPSFLLVETTGPCLVDVVLSDSLASAEAPAHGVAAWLAGQRGWRSETVCGTDRWLVRSEIVAAVLDAPAGLVSNRLWTACMLGAPLWTVVDCVTTPQDLVLLLPLLRDMAADALDPAVAGPTDGGPCA